MLSLAFYLIYHLGNRYMRKWLKFLRVTWFLCTHIVFPQTVCIMSEGITKFIAVRAYLFVELRIAHFPILKLVH